MTAGAATMDTRDLAARIRMHTLKMTSRGGSSHIGSALSIADILAVLYGSVMRVDPKQPRWPDRDRFILSKGHAGAGSLCRACGAGILSGGAARAALPERVDT